MAGMTIRDYSNLVVASPVDTTLLEWRDPSERLIAVCIMDRTRDGLSAVYSFFDPDQPRRSLGTNVVLSLIDLAREQGRPYVYLGFWVPESAKMAYKAEFAPIECFTPAGWRRLDSHQI